MSVVEGNREFPHLTSAKPDHQFHVIQNQRTARLHLPCSNSHRYIPASPCRKLMHRWPIRSRGVFGFLCDARYAAEPKITGRRSGYTLTAIMYLLDISPKLDPPARHRAGSNNGS